MKLIIYISLVYLVYNLEHWWDTPFVWEDTPYGSKHWTYKGLVVFLPCLGNISLKKDTKSGQIRSGQCNSGGNFSTEAKLLQASSRIDAGTLGLMLGFLNFLMPWCRLLILGTHCSLMPAASKWRFSPTQPLSLTSLPRISLFRHILTSLSFPTINTEGMRGPA